ncbi:hypothetical protein L7F22_002835 [Adiantum nelumboides]|nr:hypothetical protein [Adiantum nelumboides]
MIGDPVFFGMVAARQFLSWVEEKRAMCWREHGRARGDLKKLRTRLWGRERAKYMARGGGGGGGGGGGYAVHVFCSEQSKDARAGFCKDHVFKQLCHFLCFSPFGSIRMDLKSWVVELFLVGLEVDMQL